MFTFDALGIVRFLILVTFSVPLNALAALRDCRLHPEMTAVLATRRHLDEGLLKEVCEGLKGSSDIAVREDVLEKYIRFIDRLDEPDSLGRTIELEQLSLRRLGAIGMALRVLLYSDLAQDTLTPAERGFFLAVAVATAGILSFHATYIRDPGGVVPEIQKIVSPVTFEPINKAQRWVLYEFLTRFLLKSRCGGTALANLDLSRVIQKTVGPGKYPISSDKPACIKFMSSKEEVSPEDFVPCEQEVLQWMYEPEFDPVFSMAMHTPASVWFAAAPIHRAKFSDQLLFPTLDEYWTIHRPVSIYSFADYEFRTPWCAHIMKSISDYAKGDSDKSRIILEDARNTALGFLAPDFGLNCEPSSGQFTFR